MKITKDTPATARDGLERAARWRLLSLLFSRPRAGWLAEIRSIADETHDPGFAAAARAAASATEGGYLRVLGPGGAVSPREVAYLRLGDPGRVLSDVVGYYRAFDYRPRAEEPADHVAVEAGFVGYLALKEAYLLSRGDADGVRTIRGAAHSFLAEHLGGFAGEVAARLESADAGHLSLAARLLAERCPRAARSEAGGLRVVRGDGTGARELAVEDDGAGPTCEACGRDPV